MKSNNTKEELYFVAMEVNQKKQKKIENKQQRLAAYYYFLCKKAAKKGLFTRTFRISTISKAFFQKYFEEKGFFVFFEEGTPNKVTISW